MLVRTNYEVARVGSGEGNVYTEVMSKPIILDNELMYQPRVEFGISQETLDKSKDHIQKSIKNVDQRLESKEYGFVETLDEVMILDQIESLKQKYDWVDYLVVIGIGGSDLGARVIHQAFGWNTKVKVLFHGDTPDPVALTRLLSGIDLKTTLFNVVSKSGTTLEIISQYVYLKDHLQSQVDDWSKHFVFTTDAKKGLLRREAEENNVDTLPIPDNVGGRFSVLSSVGLFPAAMMGVDLKQLLTGGKKAIQDRLELAKKLATDQYLLYLQDIPLVSIMPYAVGLEEFGRWFRQLWAESLGKDQAGILPLQARGPADQHSQIQYYNQGKPLLSVLFLSVLEPDLDYKIDNVDIDDVGYLAGHSFHQILNYEQKATALSLKSSGRPSSTLSLKKLTPTTLGMLFVLFEMSVVYLAEMLKVNAFDQPGVEMGKKLTYAMMGNKEYRGLLDEVKTNASD